MGGESFYRASDDYNLTGVREDSFPLMRVIQN